MAKELTKEDLLSITKKPLEAEMPLKTLAEFYDTYLTRKYFNYTLEYEDIDGNVVNREVKLLFETDNLTHLLGFQHIFDGLADATKYEGADGYIKIIDEDVTMKTFKEAAFKEKYKKYKERILFFPFIYQLLKNPIAVCFSPEDVSLTKVNLKSEFIFYDSYVNRYLHLGIDFNSNQPAYFFPRTFFVRKDSKYFENQITAKIIKSSVTAL